jgi:hypothetical protein
METNAEPKTNTQAVLSLIFGILTVLSFCVGAAPIPFTGYICFPLSFLCAMLALTFGTLALNRIRKRNEAGRLMAWAGIIIGGIVFLCALCMAVSFAALFIFAPDYVPTPHFPDVRQF